MSEIKKAHLSNIMCVFVSIRFCARTENQAVLFKNNIIFDVSLGNQGGYFLPIKLLMVNCNPSFYPCLPYGEYINFRAFLFCPFGSF